MDHGEVPSNLSTGLPLMNIPTNHPYDSRYALLMGLVPEIDPPNVLHQTLQNWTTPPATSVVTQSPPPTLRFREIRPRPPSHHRAAKTLPIPRHDSATRGSISLSPEHPPNHQEDIHEPQSHSPAIQQMQSPGAMLSPTQHPYISQGHEYSAQAPVQAVQEALKGLVLQALRVLRDTAKEYRELNLELGTIDCWTAEIEGVDATQIDVSSNPALSELAPFEILNQILTESIAASGPMRVLIFRNQALELLIYIQTYAEKYHLIQNPRVYVDIGRWMERLRQGKHDEQVK